TLLHVSFAHPFLQRIASIKLVDLPGLDSGVPGREQLLRDVLPQSLAYLLVFSADEPIVKESIALFLSELCLRNVPVFAVLNKCDKIAPEELEQAQQFLKEQLCRMFHLPDVTICCVSAREKGGTDPLAELLLSLQARADTLARQKFSRLLSDYCRELRQYLSFRLSFEALPVSELDSRICHLKNQAAALMQALEQEDSRFLDRVEGGKQAVQRRLNQALEDAALPIETMLFAGQNPYTYVDGMLRSTLAAGVLDFFEPAVGSYLRQMVGLLERRGASKKTGGVIERFRRQATERCAQKVATPAIETLLSCLPDTRPLFEQLIGTGKFLSEKQRGALHTNIKEILLPQLREAFAQRIDNGLEQSAEAVRQMALHAAVEESRTQERALFDIQLAKQSDDSIHQKGRQRLCDDLAAVDALLAELGERKEVTV
ncbi:MAG: GTPase domain-containing protein, partial [Oscillospiraceae bacterium]